jgi:hypothetical protein
MFAFHGVGKQHETRAMGRQQVIAPQRRKHRNELSRVLPCPMPGRQFHPPSKVIKQPVGDYK